MANQIQKVSEILAKKLLAAAEIGVDAPGAANIRVHDPRFYQDFMLKGTLGLGESYMDGLWDSDDLCQMMANFSRAKLALKFKNNPYFISAKAVATVLNQGNRLNAKFGIRSHYDIGNDLYSAMLDPTMNYTCAVWEGAQTLEQAQINKMELICKKLMLKPGLTVLDIGCGWGGFAKYASEKYGVTVTGVTISEEQYKLCIENNKNTANKFLLQDYRDVQGKFDRILSIGMFEHVCYKNHRTYMQKTYDLLADDGIMLLHTMGRKKTVVKSNDQWITKYIFPNTQVPSVQDLGRAIDGLWVMEDWENLSVNYEKTLLAWNENFVRNYATLDPAVYDQRFYRMWTYYLQIFAGWFRSRALQLWQVVLTKEGQLGGYEFQQKRLEQVLGG